MHPRPAAGGACRWLAIGLMSRQTQQHLSSESALMELELPELELPESVPAPFRQEPQAQDHTTATRIYFACRLQPNIGRCKQR